MAMCVCPCRCFSPDWPDCRAARIVAALQPGCEEMKREWGNEEETERKWRENEEMRRKWRENEEMERDWLSTFPHSLSISVPISCPTSWFPPCAPPSKCLCFIAALPCYNATSLYAAMVVLYINVYAIFTMLNKLKLVGDLPTDRHVNMIHL